MNFNLVLLFLLVACGVKGDPVAPKDAGVPSVMSNYPDVQLEKPLEENKKK